MSNYKQAIAAAKWWREKLGGGFSSDNGDMLQSVMLSLIPKLKISSTQLDLFQQYLESAFNGEILKRDIDVSPCKLGSVDYEPCDILYAAYLHATGVMPRTGDFPCKTRVIALPDCIQVKCGYSAEWQTINC